MKYKYKAHNSKGEIERGIVEAMTESAAIEILQKRGLIITELGEIEAKRGLQKELRILPKKVKPKDLVFFYRQLAILFASGTSLVQALNSLKDQTQNSLLKEQVENISNDINGGASFSDALASYPRTFSRFVVSMVRVGEIGGQLSKVLEYLADHQEREYTLVSKIKGAMYYPAFILIFCVGILVLMLTFVMPRIIPVFEQFGSQLPLPTKIMIGVSKFFSSYFWLIFLIAGGIIFFLYRYIKSPAGKAKKDRLIIKIPVIGSIFQNMYFARMSENLSTLIRGGIPIAQAIDNVADVMGNSLYEKLLRNARDNVRRGGEISDVFETSELVSQTFTQMIKSGEETGKLDKVLFDLSVFYNGEVSRSVDNLMSLLEPVMLIGIGVVVFILAITVYVPIYNLVNAIH